ncbi:MAG: ThuA domain-containing protein [Sphingobacteriales bacterium]|nr:MAG: ThuA domain-containing protein [Sphingobacteriales bacterium]
MTGSEKMLQVFKCLILLLIPVFLLGCKHETLTPPAQPKRILLVTKTQGFRHESIADGISMFRQIADTPQYVLTHTEMTDSFTKTYLARYQLIILLNTTGNLFTTPQKEALIEFVRAGGSVLGIHAASDAEYDWPWYNQMLGAWFSDHPAIQEADCEVVMPGHVSAGGIPLIWKRTDEWYNFKSLQPDNRVVINLKESTYTGGKHGTDHPISWYREFEGGRIFYTGMGHTSETYSDPLFRQHIKGAMDWLLDK